MAGLYGAQRMVLQAIQDLPKNAAGYVTEAKVARSTKIPVEEVRDWMETLEEAGYVDVARTRRGLTALINAAGRLELRKKASRKETKGNMTVKAIEAIKLEPDELVPVVRPATHIRIKTDDTSSAAVSVNQREGEIEIEITIYRTLSVRGPQTGEQLYEVLRHEHLDSAGFPIKISYLEHILDRTMSSGRIGERPGTWPVEFEVTDKGRAMAVEEI